MALMLQAADVADLLPMDRAVSITEELFREQAKGRARPHTPIRVRVPRGSLRIVSGALLGSQIMGTRVGAASGMPGDTTFIALFDTELGNLLCLMAYPFGTVRTGATIGVATKWLADPGASSIGMIGTGRNALSLLEAMAAVRPIRRIQVFSRNPDHRASFAQRAELRLGIEVEPVSTAKAALAGVDVVACSTNASDPVFDPKDVPPHAHINSMGSPNEIPEAVWLNAGGRFVGNKFQERQFEHYHAFTQDVPRHALVELARQGKLDWDKDVQELGDLMGTGSKRPSGTTVFKESQGGCGDVALAEYVFHRCVELGRGTELDLRTRSVESGR